MAKVEITPELLGQYKGLLPCSSEMRHKFTPQTYNVLPAELRPSFTVRPLSRVEKVEYFSTQDADRTREIIVACIVGVDNLRYADTGAVIEAMDMDVYASLHYDVINDIRDQIMRISSLCEVEKLGLK